MHVIYTPMSIDGESGYFLSDDEYHKLHEAANGDTANEYLESVEAENDNLRNTISDAVARMRKLVYDLGNA